MRHLFTILAGLVLLSCSNSDEHTLPKSATTDAIEGTWVIKMINYKTLYTNEYFACRFNSDGTEEYFSLVSENDGSTTLTYTDDTTYSVEDGVITMTSGSVDLSFSASTYNGELAGELGTILRYTEITNIQDGVDECSGRTFTAMRTAADYSSEVIGLWEGTVIEGDVDEPFDSIRLEFLGDNTYNFYSPNDDGSWTLLERGNIYATMGNLLATQWTEDGGITSAEIWETEINGDTMTWRATREGIDNPTGFNLVRVY